ncbi:MAG: MFS transporter [Gammaproteobacteria bacterium]|nr:MFS transporter [Gammaproteobacteria bacterium]NNJ97312.1 MFS transporter [Gammaproteobacteria bacterium]
MSTIVVVKKAGQVCIAADSLTSFGDLRMAADYEASHDKILIHGDNHLGIVGSAAHQLVMESIVKHDEIKVDFSSRLAVFETFRSLHPILKDKYFLNAKDEDDDPYESTQLDALIACPHGIYGVHSLREVCEYKRFWAIGSGSEYALGAMYAVYDLFDKAEEIAKAGVMAGAEFNNASALPMSSYTVDLLKLKSVSG